MAGEGNPVVSEALRRGARIEWFGGIHKWVWWLAGKTKHGGFDTAADAARDFFAHNPVESANG